MPLAIMLVNNDMLCINLRVGDFSRADSVRPHKDNCCSGASTNWRRVESHLAGFPNSLGVGNLIMRHRNHFCITIRDLFQ